MKVIARLAAFVLLLTAAAFTVAAVGTEKEQESSLADLIGEGSLAEMQDVEPLEPEPLVAGDVVDEIILE
jgi:hypothetical protein